MQLKELLALVALDEKVVVNDGNSVLEFHMKEIEKVKDTYGTLLNAKVLNLQHEGFKIRVEVNSLES